MNQVIVGTQKIITLGVLHAFGSGSIMQSEDQPTGDPNAKVLRTWTIDVYRANMPPISVSLIEEWSNKRYLNCFMGGDDGPQILGVPVDPERVAAALGEIVRLYNGKYQ